ncbi:hypothetical protein C8R45DRAFT_1114526 [Mycena sanguinolenta]|nr:hypothetical protein C8R45DRAFT_1114526 [Mycena sanguinolenta]
MARSKRGNKGFFHGDTLTLLHEHLPTFLATTRKQKQEFWLKFFAAWDDKFEALSTPEREELQTQEAAYKEEVEHIKKHNKKMRGRCKGNFVKFLVPPDCLKELRAQSADETQKLKNWFNNTQTKDKQRKVEPFHTWLVSLMTVRGHPQRIQLPWVLWQHPKHREVLRVCYCKKYGKDADAEAHDAETEEGSEQEKGEDNDEEPNFENDNDDTDAVHTQTEQLHNKYHLGKAYYDKLTPEDQKKVQEMQEENYQERHTAHERALNEAISQRTLDALCTQLCCKSILLLGEIVEGEEDGDGAAFISMVQQGALAKHPNVDIVKWAPDRSKALVQFFADFLVACKKDEQGLLGSLIDPGAPGAPSPSLCTHCMGSLIPLGPGSTEPSKTQPQSATYHDTTKKTAEKAAGKNRKNKTRRKERKRDEGGPSYSLKYTPNSPRQRALAAMPKKAHDKKIWEYNTISSYEFDHEKNIARNTTPLQVLLPGGGVAALGTPKHTAAMLRVWPRPPDIAAPHQGFVPWHGERLSNPQSRQQLH